MDATQHALLYVQIVGLVFAVLTLLLLVVLPLFDRIFAAKEKSQQQPLDSNDDIRNIVHEMQFDAEYARLTLVLDEVLVDAMTDYDPTSQRYKDIVMIREVLRAFKTYR